MPRPVLGAAGGRAVLSVPTMWARSAVVALLIFGSLLPDGSLVQTGAAVVAAPLVFHDLIARPLPHLHAALRFVVPLFGALLVPALLVTPTTQYGHDKVADLATLSLFTALAAVLIRDREHLLIFVRVWVILGVILALASLTGGDGTGGSAGRATGFGSNPIGLARPIASALVATAWLATRRAWTWPRALPVTAVLLAGLFVTGSKGPLMAAVAGVFVVAMADPRYRASRVIRVALVLAAGYVVVASVDSLATSRAGRFVLSPTEVSDPIRSEAIARSWAFLRDHWSGVGYGNWSAAVGDPLLDYPHNIWLEVAVEAGVLVAAALVCAIATAMVRLARGRDAEPLRVLCLGWLVAECVSASLTGDVRVRSLFFFLTLGWLVAQGRWRASVHDEEGAHPRLELVDLGLQGGERGP
jgi:hypothetical protein